ncbi:phasin family protein [Ottowia sp.]|uniref:phasin family protein n=1 Tax=Ottowia sp. TaxID=1898956 RepID=UPI00262D7DB8|nr:phasin family protein [Ottowia sp.]
MATRSRKTPEASTAAPTASPPPASGPDAEQSHNIWLAGLGAMARAQAEGSKAFDALVKQGLDWQSQAREQIAEVTQRAEALAASAAPAATGRWNALEGIFEQRVARALTSLGMPSAQELLELRARVEVLEKALTAREASASARREASPRPTAERQRK